jgi:branched-chain amino acid transport system ATP-binding protein
MLAIARGLMARPKLLLIDEASLGLAPTIVQEIFRIARQLASDGTTVILVEQNVGALAVADVGYFMQQGEIVAELHGDELDDAERIRTLYLG